METQYIDKTSEILQYRILRNLAELKTPSKLPTKRRILTQDLYEKILRRQQKGEIEKIC